MRQLGSRWTKLFKANVNLFQRIVADLVKGKQMDVENMDRHIEIYANLCGAKAVIDETMQMRTYDESDVVGRVLEARLVYLANRFWRHNAKQLIYAGSQLGLEDLIIEILQYVSVFSNRGITSKPTTSKIAAVVVTSGASSSATSYAQQLVSSPPKPQPSDVCEVCGGMHATQLCNILANANVEERVQRLAAKGLCFPLLQKQPPGEELRGAAKVRNPELQEDTCDAFAGQENDWFPFRFYISPAPAAMLEAAGASVPAAAAASMSAVANPII